MARRVVQIGMNPGASWRSPRPTGAEAGPPPDVERQLRIEIADFLLSDDVHRKIDFQLGRIAERIHITGEKLRQVGRRLQEEELKLKIADEELDKLDYGAAFSRHNKKFMFRSAVMYGAEEVAEMPDLMARGVGETLFRGDALTKGLVVHEAVHALLGFEGRALVRLSDESAAYIAEVLFHVLFDTYDFLLAHSDDGREIYEAARAIIAEHGLDTNPGARVTWLQYRDLAKTIRANDAYNHLGRLERYKRSAGA